MTPRINWLASYPKSGNTWVRVFLSNLTQGAAAPVDINALAHASISSERTMFDAVLGYDTGDLSPEEITRLRPEVYRWMNAGLTGPVYCKTHDACIQLDSGAWLMAPEVTDQVIYVLRNPLDVAVSMSHHMGQPIDDIIALMAKPDATMARQEPGAVSVQLEQRLGPWSEHVQSWTDNSLFRTHVVRYEDLHADPHRAFRGIMDALKLPHDQTDCDRAIGHAAFDGLQSQETASGFRENPSGSSAFFREGQVGGWQDTLTGRQIDKIVEDHLQVMRLHGYVDGSGHARAWPATRT